MPRQRAPLTRIACICVRVCMCQGASPIMVIVRSGTPAFGQS